MSSPDLRSALADRVEVERLDWLDEAIDAVRTSPAVIRSRFPAVSRKLGRGPLAPTADPDDPFAVTIDDAGRSLLVAALSPEDQAAELPDLYRHGDTRERRGALRALDHVGADGPLAPVARDLVDDAMRTNDTRLVAAALGPVGSALLDDDAFAQAVLKCVFTGLDIDRIPGLAGRVTPELSRMMADFVHERIAAGRDVPAQVWPVIDAHPPEARLTAIQAETVHPVPERAKAARDALAKRRAS